MTTVRSIPRYHDNLTYPVVVGNRIVEVDGRILNQQRLAQPANITVSQYQELLHRIGELERIISKNGRPNPT